MAGAGGHTDVPSVISGFRTPSFTQIRPPNPRLAVLSSGRRFSGFSVAKSKAHVALLPSSMKKCER